MPRHETVTAPWVPVKEGCETLPFGVNSPVDVSALPLNVAFNSAPEPVNVGWETLPEGVKLPVEVSEFPLNVPFNSAPVPVNVGWDTLPLGVKLPVEVVAEPVNFNSTPVPENEPPPEVALLTLVAIVWLLKLGRVTAVGVFAVKLPAVHESVSVSFATLVERVGSVQLAALPAVTEPPPVALEATYLVAVLSVTVGLFTVTLPAGV